MVLIRLPYFILYFEYGCIQTSFPLPEVRLHCNGWCWHWMMRWRCGSAGSSCARARAAQRSLEGPQPSQWKRCVRNTYTRTHIHGLAIICVIRITTTGHHPPAGRCLARSRRLMCVDRRQCACVCVHVCTYTRDQVWFGRLSISKYFGAACIVSPGWTNARDRIKGYTRVHRSPLSNGAGGVGAHVRGGTRSRQLYQYSSNVVHMWMMVRYFKTARREVWRRHRFGIRSDARRERVSNAPQRPDRISCLLAH